jgi:hypothetical protein
MSRNLFSYPTRRGGYCLISSDVTVEIPKTRILPVLLPYVESACVLDALSPRSQRHSPVSHAIVQNDGSLCVRPTYQMPFVARNWREGKLCLVFWTGVPESSYSAGQNDMGPRRLRAQLPLFHDRDLNSTRQGKSPKGWSKYMKGASGRFAQYACRDRLAIALTNPPPHIYSLRKGFTFRDLEKSILKGEYGGSSAIKIDLVHSTVAGAADFRYQAWALDRSWEWVLFFKNALQKTLGDALIKCTTPRYKHITQDLDGQEVTRDEHNKLERGANVLCKELVKQPAKLRVKTEQHQAQERKDAGRKKVKDQQKQAQEKQAGQ